MRGVIIFEDDFCLIPVNAGSGKYSWMKVSDIDAYDLSLSSWSLRNGYARCDRDCKSLMAHRLILKPAVGICVDHKNLDKLDNRRENIRIATRQQNNMNRKPKNEYKGITWNKSRRKFQSKITINKQAIHLGWFDKQEEAAKRYDEKAIELFGEFRYVEEKK